MEIHEMKSMFEDFLKSEGAFKSFMKNLNVSIGYDSYFEDEFKLNQTKEIIVGAFIWNDTDNPKLWERLDEKWSEMIKGRIKNECILSC